MFHRLHRLLAQALMIFVMLILLGCEDVKNAGENVKKATENVEKATKNVESAAVAVSEGLKELDPAGIKKLLTENTNIRALAERLQRELSNSSNRGVVELSPSSKVILYITGYLGDLRIDGWIDREDNVFMKNVSLADGELVLGVDYSIAENFVLKMERAAIASMQGIPLPHPVMCPGITTPVSFVVSEFAEGIYKKRGEIDGLYRSSVKTAFEAYIKGAGVVPGNNDYREHSIDRRFHTNGDHDVYLRITPTKPNSSGKWMLSWKIVEIRKDYSVNQIHIQQVDSDTSAYELGKPIRYLAGRFRVKIADVN